MQACPLVKEAVTVTAKGGGTNAEDWKAKHGERRSDTLEERGSTEDERYLTRVVAQVVRTGSIHSQPHLFGGELRWGCVLCLLFV